MVGFRTIRYGGLAGAGLLALAGWLGGALPRADQGVGPVALGAWLLGTTIMGYAWWAARDRVQSPRWAVVTGALWTVPFLVAPPLASRDGYSYACQGHVFATGGNPYDAGALACPWISAVAPMWRDAPAPYGPAFVLLAAGAVVVGGSLIGALLTLRLLSVAGLVVIALSVPVLARRCGVPPERALWLALAGPLVGVHLVAGVHNDSLMVAGAVGGLALLAWAGDRPIIQAAAGTVLGLAVAIKVTAIVVIPFALLIPAALRAAASTHQAHQSPATPHLHRLHRPRAAGGSNPPGASAVSGAALVGVSGALAMVGVTLGSGLGFGWVGGLGRTTDLVQFTSPPTAVGMIATYAGRVVDRDFDAVPAVRAAAVLILAIVLGALWVRLLRMPGDRVPAILRTAAAASAAVVVLAPAFHPWYLVFPLVLLAATAHRTAPIALVTIAASVLALPDGMGLARFAKLPGAALITGITIVLIVRWVRALRMPTSVSGFP